MPCDGFVADRRSSVTPFESTQPIPHEPPAPTVMVDALVPPHGGNCGLDSQTCTGVVLAISSYRRGGLAYLAGSQESEAVVVQVLPSSPVQVVVPPTVLQLAP